MSQLQLDPREANRGSGVERNPVPQWDDRKAKSKGKIERHDIIGQKRKPLFLWKCRGKAMLN